MEQQKFEDDSADLEITDYVVLDDATTGSGSHLDLSNLRKRKTKIISSAKETIENGESSFYPSAKPIQLVISVDSLNSNRWRLDRAKQFSWLRHQTKKTFAKRKNRNSFSSSHPAQFLR